MKAKAHKKGTVYLVGAGPGDPSLITLRGLKLLKRAEVVFHDHLIHPELLRFCPNAQLYYVGKVGYGNRVKQEEIEHKLVEAAKNYSTIVRLKGGDPFIFGRGGEEAEALAKHQIPFEVVPGVSSFSAVPTYAGIPLTHRDFGSSLAMITGHRGGDGDTLGFPPDLNWPALSKMSTLVIFMGVKNLAGIVSKLIEAGKEPKTPVAIITWGTYPKQKTIKCYLKEIPQLIKKYKLESPSIIVIGEVVALQENLNWFEQRPLFGKRILVTRSRSQASALARPLSELGAEIIELPTIQLAEPKSWKPVDQAIKKIESYDWILFTSVNGVESFFNRLQKQGQDIRILHRAKLGAVGPATAEALKSRGLKVIKQPKEFITDALAKSFSRQEISEKSILIPRAAKAREEILHLLKKLGARVEVVAVYEIRKPSYTKKQLKDLFATEALDILTFASSATVQSFYDLLKNTSYLKSILKIPTFVIGPITAKRAKALGFKKIKIAQEYTIKGLVKLILSEK